jgi:protein gp37
MARRLQAMGQPNYADGFAPRFHPAMLSIPAKHKKPTEYFVNSMSDLFHKEFSDSEIFEVISAMLAAPWHKYMVLTKRADRMAELVMRYFKDMALSRLMYVDIWWGASMENQATANERMPALIELSKAGFHTFISAEPLLGPIDFSLWPNMSEGVIVGGESGQQARPMHPDWARSIRDQCQTTNTKFFFKQWGEWEPVLDLDAAAARHEFGCYGWNDNTFSRRVGKRRAGRLLDGVEHNDLPWR